MKFFDFNELIDFNRMSTCQGLFYAKKLENHIYCSGLHFFVLLFFKSFLGFFFAQNPIEYK